MADEEGRPGRENRDSKIPPKLGLNNIQAKLGRGESEEENMEGGVVVTGTGSSRGVLPTLAPKPWPGVHGTPQLSGVSK